MRVRDSFGLCNGTSWPAPRTTTKVRPAYSCVHPPTCPSSYHARQGFTVGSLSASMLYRVEVTGIMASVSPLNTHIRSPECMSS
uniref:Serine carboxypeptidase II-2-like n=1 Tax=Rhizophora mucronata TaxID=61149 RepID=A0A2P2K9P3_RHIMU